MTKLKKCQTCKKTLPINEFYKRHSNKDGLATSCKSCVKKESKIVYYESLSEASKKKFDSRAARERERERLFAKGLKECSVCKQILEINSFFNKEKARKDGFASSCKNCKIEIKNIKRAKINELKKQEKKIKPIKPIKPIIANGDKNITLTCVNDNCNEDFITTIAKSTASSFNGECPKCYKITQKIQYLKRKKYHQATYTDENRARFKKVCKSCGKTLTLENFGKDPRRSDAHKSVCKTCLSKNNKLKYQAMLSKSQRTKRCIACLKELPIINFKRGVKTCVNCKANQQKLELAKMSAVKKRRKAAKQPKKKSLLATIFAKIKL